MSRVSSTRHPVTLFTNTTVTFDRVVNDSEKSSTNEDNDDDDDDDEIEIVEGEVQGEAASAEGSDSPVVLFFSHENHHQTVAFLTAFTHVASAAVYKYVGRFNDNDRMILLNFFFGCWPS
jgi:hypothetical protein